MGLRECRRNFLKYLKNASFSKTLRMGQILIFVLKNSAITPFKLVIRVWERHLFLKKIYSMYITEDKIEFAVYCSWSLNGLSNR